MGNSLGGYEAIDLTPLKNFPQLKELDLSFGSLSSLDLTPLTHCPNLEVLNLYNNWFRRIDLPPLAPCSSLKRFTLDDAILLFWSSDRSFQESKKSSILNRYQSRIQKKEEH
ncbi:MAG: leucine-rich repeat domain-containing protein [Asgard group archaeon]|nr:leucine-rich repeat domain-containing protein [Asgard group archaeon]